MLLLKPSYFAQVERYIINVLILICIVRRILIDAEFFNREKGNATSGYLYRYGYINSHVKSMLSEPSCARAKIGRNEFD